MNEFVKDCKDLFFILKLFKKQIKVIVPLKEQELAFYKHFVEFGIKYEELNSRNVKFHGEFALDINVNLLTGEGKTMDLKDNL
mgnify:CR=1 FL=1